MKILLIDGNAADRAAALRALERALGGIESREADGPESLGRALSAQRCDLAVVDRRLPWMDGLALAGLLRERYPEASLLLLCGEPTLEAGVEAVKAGFDGCLPKAALHGDRFAKEALALLDERRGRRREAWAESRLQELLARLNVGVYRATSRGIMLYANAAFCRIFGIPSWKDAPTWSLRGMLLDPSEEARLARDLKRTGFLQGVELKLKGPGGKDQWISLTQILRHGGESLDVIEGLVEDITERKQQALAARRREEEIRNQAKLESVGQLAGGVAHDFNNLLTTINGYSELLLANLPGGGLKDCATEVRKAGYRAAHLTRQLLAFSSRLLLRPKRVCLNTMLRRMERSMRESLGDSVRLVCNLDPGLEPVFADPSHLEDVIMGLVHNAREAMPSGGRLCLATSALTVPEEGWSEFPDATGFDRLRPGPYALLRIEDSGLGMSKETLARIFEPFFTTKAMSGGSPGTAGAGLGLATAYGILKQTGGSIHADSEPGKGSRFRLYIPQSQPWRMPADNPGSPSQLGLPAA